MKLLRSKLGLAIGTLAVASAPTTVTAATDLVALTRSHFPERPWFPMSAADAALAGAGRAIDPASSWSTNPALAGLVGTRAVRVTAAALDPRRTDLQAATQRYSDSSPHLTFGELGMAVPHGSLAYSLYAAQDAYDKQEDSFLDPAPPPIDVTNEARFALQRAGLGVAASQRNARFGVAAEVRRSLMTLVSTPSQEAQDQYGVRPAAVRLSGIGFGGAAGFVWRTPAWALGGSARLATNPPLKDESGARVGRDGIPLSANLGLKLGSDSGGRIYLGAAYDGAREVALGDSVGRGVERSPKRIELAAGYSFRPQVAPWEFRAGLGWSPYPGDGGPRFKRMGVGIGYDFEGWLARISYAREERHGADDAESARSIFVFGLDARY